MSEQYDYLTDDEVSRLILSVLEMRHLTGQNGATEAELTEVVDWAKQVRIEHAALDLVLDGKLLLDVRDGEMHFCLPKRLVQQGEGESE